MTISRSLSWHLAVLLSICILGAVFTGVGFAKEGHENASDTAFLIALGFLILLWRLGEAEYEQGKAA